MLQLKLFSLLILPLLASANLEGQTPLNPTAMTDPYTPLTSTQPTIADLLTIESSASIFFSYARELQLSAQFNDADIRQTLFVPTNKAVMALARKPHQNTGNNEGVILTEAELDAQSKENVERWISAHIIPQSPVMLSPGVYPTLLDGRPLTIKEVPGSADSPAWTRVVLNDGIHIISAKEASNGIVYMIDDTVKLD